MKGTVITFRAHRIKTKLPIPQARKVVTVPDRAQRADHSETGVSS
jgi:hypothetical protein